ncbi:MAG: asparaginase [Thermoanaerobaculia bacterium]
MLPPETLVRVHRGGRVESEHRGDVAVADSGGALLASCGDPDRGVFVRSAAKPFQALPFLAAGGARKFRLGDDEIALMCASHGGEPRHVRLAGRMLRKGGFSENDLVCGAHLPLHEPSARALVRSGDPVSPLHNNCSGQHAALLLSCRLFGYPKRGYETPDHPLQQRIRQTFAAYAGVSQDSLEVAVDGCGIPVFYAPLSSLARAYARLMARRQPGESVEDLRARALVVRAMWESPAMVAGQGRFTTELLEVGKRRWVGKEGAEGVYAIGLRPRRPGARPVGIAFKIEDGSSRGRDAVSLALLDQLGHLDDIARRRLAAHEFIPVCNATGRVVGRIEAALPPLRMRDNPRA